MVQERLSFANMMRAKMPAALPPLALLGPGYVLASFAFGSGELIWWPTLSAKYGLAFVWLLVPAALLQWWINLELARYVVITGESPWVGFARLNRAFSILLWVMAIVTLSAWGGYAGAAGNAIAFLTGFPPGWGIREQTTFWAYVTMALSILGLTLFPVVYKGLEWLLKICIIIGAGGVVVAAINPLLWSKWPEFAAAIFTPRPFPANWDPRDTGLLVTAIAFAGLGGFFQLAYAYWIRDANAGMGGLIGRITSPITGRPEPVQLTGYLPEGSEDDKRNYRGWMKTVYLNNSWGVFINLLTTMLMMFLAYAVLHPQGRVPGGYALVVEQGQFFGFYLGEVGFRLFLFVAAMLIVDTYIVILDLVCRMYSESILTHIPPARKKSYRWWYYALVGVFAVVTSTNLLIGDPATLILWGGVFNFIAMPVLYVAMLVINYYVLPKHGGNWLRPSMPWLIVGLVSTAVYIYLVLWYLQIQVPVLIRSITGR